MDDDCDDNYHRSIVCITSAVRHDDDEDEDYKD